MLNADKIMSQDSRQFLENLRLYLVSSGKKTSEMEEIIQELEVHLLEAERNNKSVDQIIGKSPKEYMKALSDEMSNDYIGWMKYIPMLFLGVLSNVMIQKAVTGAIEFTILEIIGYPLAGILLIFVYMLSFRYVASNKLSSVKQSIFFYSLGIFSIGLFLGLIVLSDLYSTTVIKLETIGTLITVVLAISIFIILSIWTKSWVSIFIPIFLFLPQLLLNLTQYQESVKVLLSSLITMLCILTYCGYTLIKVKSS